VLAEGEEPVLGVLQTAVLVVESSSSGVLGGKPQRKLASGATAHNLGGRVDPQAVGSQVSEKGSVSGGRDFCRPGGKDQNPGRLTVTGGLLCGAARIVGLLSLGLLVFSAQLLSVGRLLPSSVLLPCLLPWWLVVAVTGAGGWLGTRLAGGRYDYHAAEARPGLFNW